MSDCSELNKTRYHTILGAVGFICLCIWFTSWVYCYFAFPTPKLTDEEIKLVKKVNELDKRVYDLETFNSNLKILIDLKRKMERPE